MTMSVTSRSFVAILGPHADGLGTVGCLEDAVAVMPEDVRHDFAHGGLVLDDEDGLVAAAQLGVFTVGRRDGRHFADREEDFQVGAPAHLAAHFDPAFLLRDDAVNRGESEAAAFADFLGGEKWLEDAAERGGVHAAARVGEAEADEASGAGLRVAAGLRAVEFHRGGADDELAALRHRVAGVHHEVDDDLLDVALVGVDGGEAGGELAAEVNVLADELGEHLVQIAHDGVQVEHLGLHDLLAAEGEELAGEGGGALGGEGDLVERIGDVLFEIVRGEMHAGVPLYHGEHVVEVVRHAGGKLAHGLELLGMPELLLEFALLAHILGGDERHGLIAELEGLGGDHAVANLAGACAQLALEAAHGAFFAELQPQEQRRLGVGAEIEFAGRAADDFETPEAAHAEKGLVHIEEAVSRP
jgi:hypothetical protein